MRRCSWPLACWRSCLCWRLIASAGWLIEAVSAHGIAYGAACRFHSFETEPRLNGRTLHEKRQPHSFPPSRRIEGADAYIEVWIGSAAGPDLLHDPGRIAQIEHRQAPHVPVGIAGVNVIRELHAHRPFLAKAILNLVRDLPVRQIGKKRESALGHVHVDL